MVLPKISQIFFLQLATGASFVLICLKNDRLGKGFYIVNTVLALISAILALLFELTIQEMHQPVALTESIIMAVCLFLAAAAQALQWRIWVFWLCGAFVAGALSLCAETTTLAPHVLDAGFIDNVFRVTPFILGSFLLGCSVVGMNLGHWYLISRGLPFYLLENTARVFIGLVLIRTLFLITTVSAFYFLPGTGRGVLSILFAPDGFLVFLLMRILWGLAGPFVLGVLVFRCVEIKSNTSATGLMYVVVVSLLIGELLANYVTVLTSVPV